MPADHRLQPVQRRAEHRQKPADLAAAAPRQHRQDEFVVGDAVDGAEPRRIAPVGAALDCRVPDITAGQPDGLEIRWLERKQRQQMVVPARHAARPAGAPRPHHRRDVMNQR
jgi:hypothetical protein